jgi:hypothetical protein
MVQEEKSSPDLTVFQPSGNLVLSGDVSGDGNIGLAEAIYAIQTTAGL